jgi:hypothetical protein
MPNYLDKGAERIVKTLPEGGFCVTETRGGYALRASR